MSRCWFHERVPSTCFGDKDFRAVLDGRNYSVGVHQTDHGDMFLTYCNRINVYHGWTLAGQVNLEDRASILAAFAAGGDAAGDQLDYYCHRLLGVDIRTGQVLWTLQCPNDYSSSHFVRINTDPADTMRMRCGRGGIGSLDEYLFGPATTLTPVS